MKVAILANDSTYTYNLRREILEALINCKYEVVIICQAAQHLQELKDLGCEILSVKVARHGTNPLQDISLLSFYYKTLKKLKPDVVLSYNIKPNVYGGKACAKLGIPYMANICGLGTALEYPGKLQQVTSFLYKWGLRKATCVFFQNRENQEFFEEKNLINCKKCLLPGSGVNIQKYRVLDYPDDKKIEFLFISRLMKEKGADEYLEAAAKIYKKHQNTVFHIIGGCEDKKYLCILEDLQRRNIIQYHGQQNDILPFQKISSCTIHPTYYPEGMSNVLLESAACGRPIITTDRSGCREIVEDGVNGFVCKQQDSTDLIKQIEKFLALTWAQRRDMGAAGRKKVEQEFNRQIVVDAYLSEISKALKGEMDGLQGHSKKQVCTN